MPSRRASSSEAATECGASPLPASSGSSPMKRGVWNRLLGRATRHGAVDSDSAPPATTTSASPSATARMASRMASRPEAHWRSTVSAGTHVAQACRQPDDAGRVAARGGVAEDDLVDRAGLQVGILERRQHDGRGQALDAPAPVQAARPTERRPARCNDKRRSQSRGLGHGERIHKGALRKARGSASRSMRLVLVTPQDRGEIPPSAGLSRGLASQVALSDAGAIRGQ